MDSYRIYARFIPTGKISSTVVNIAGWNALAQHPDWEILAVIDQVQPTE